ncbi:MAG: helix-turn-helix domain-containing protein [Dietzia psychralcaliphila]
MSVSGSSRLISLQEAGDYYGVSVKTVRRWIAAGRLEGYRVGPRLLRVRLDSLDSATRRLATA